MNQAILPYGYFTAGVDKTDPLIAQALAAPQRCGVRFAHEGRRRLSA